MASKEIILSVEDLKILANYAHWIPVIHGYTNQFMKETYPGWNWNDLIPKLIKNGSITYKPKLGDIKLSQGLWLNAGVSKITVKKISTSISFEMSEV
jgi:hypothetical protein